MPPSAVKTVRDLIYWQYAKIISESAGAGKKNWGFVMERFKKLQSGQVVWSSSIREYLKEKEKPGECIYCGAKAGLTLEHILPTSRGGPDIPDNAIMVCKSCNSAKGGKGLYEYYELDKRYEVPRIAEGKYLKLLYGVHEKSGTLEANVKDLCPKCILGAKCPVKEKLTVYCLEGVFHK